MSANKELDALQRKTLQGATEDGFVAVTCQGSQRWVTGPYSTYGEAIDRTKGYLGKVTIIAVSYEIEGNGKGAQ